MAAMVIDLEERAELPRRLFALAGRRLESAASWAGKGEAKGLSPDAIGELADNLHTCGQDLLVLADAIVAIADESDGK